MKIFILLTLSVMLSKCSPSGDTVNPTPTPVPPVVTNEMDFWLTKGNQSVTLQKQTSILAFGTAYNNYSNIEVDDSKTFQTIDGFGYTLTGGSTQVINQLNAKKRQELLKELFGANDNSIAISYLRISIGASDLNATLFTYNDLPSGQTDVNLDNFSLAPDKNDLIPMLKEIVAINPNIKIMATPWSPPVWMKDNNGFVGGSLKPEYYGVYAQYFVKYIQTMKAEGITIDAITPQNEPLHPGNNPSMLMIALHQADFIKNHLGPAFKAANLTTKIVAYDHNCNKPEYPIAVLNDPAANPYVDGSAFHLYEGDISALSTVHNAFPNKNIYFTEQYTSSTGTFDGDLKWHVKNIIIGSMRNWSKTALEWNLANNAFFGPNTPGGCTTCKGALTINSSDSFTRNVGYYIIAHASKFVPAGSVRIASNHSGNLNNVAFKTPSGKKVLIVENDGNTSEIFNIKYNGNWVTTSLEAGSVGTYIW
ncbi:glycoside hydrolase family 30 protein [Flavobacterium gawalongense]|uniref:Glucosylceramidase n=1 Tax=Flavobacterium gawalongense TaxID=2594432 RepID=A0A553BFA3_9FLAO|nr:glycoside hydrolase family 30 beta sandwich domain-containing protein [Flavobacterium gawalongense]TRW99758.1 glucosylceramidase [Flavobacterium gawalongense]TRX03855.1 glucosylceramidase [Flavobacterium gawalongense]TRX06882.1 glucosylceramidase [Flavobacterium gawalongense]TRX07623.1 glucosylceramidase [Flavobacterium gawalongense]TRX23499.1 glucosylceramidase [Flavobacterium gawalongense]